MPSHIAKTISGQVIDLFNPAPAAISIQDIAHGLAMQCRYGGQVQTFYSVAQHNLHVMSLLPLDAKPYALLYRAWAAYTGDITPGLVAVLEKSGALTPDHTVYKVVNRLDQAIHRRFGLSYPPPPIIAAKVQAADDVATETEQRDLYAHDRPAMSRARPDRRTLKPMPWVKAYSEFLMGYSECVNYTPAMARAISSTKAKGA